MSVQINTAMRKSILIMAIPQETEIELPYNPLMLLL
jgi:hypothetical protein